MVGHEVGEAVETMCGEEAIPGSVGLQDNGEGVEPSGALTEEPRVGVEPYWHTNCLIEGGLAAVENSRAVSPWYFTPLFPNVEPVGWSFGVVYNGSFLGFVKEHPVIRVHAVKITHGEGELVPGESSPGLGVVMAGVEEGLE